MKADNKLPLIVLSLLFLTFILCACEPYVHGMEWVKHPSKTTYISGVDDDIDLSDGKIRLTMTYDIMGISIPTDEGDSTMLEEFGPVIYVADYSEASSSSWKVYSNVDFSTPGDYSVRFYRGDDYLEYFVEVKNN